MDEFRKHGEQLKQQGYHNHKWEFTGSCLTNGKRKDLAFYCMGCRQWKVEEYTKYE